MDTITATADSIAELLHVRDLPAARKVFDDAIDNDPDRTVHGAAQALVRQLAATVIIPKGMLVWGFGLDIWANPYRDPDEYAWRCGDCPWTASHYRTEAAAQRSAEQHVADHHPDQPLTVVSYLDETYWDAVERQSSPMRVSK